MAQDPVKFRMKWWPEGFICMFFAVLIDCLNWIPGWGTALEVVTAMAFMWYFPKKQIPAISPKNIVALVGESIPFIQVLPLNTIAVFLTIYMARREDKGKKNPAKLLNLRKNPIQKPTLPISR